MIRWVSRMQASSIGSLSSHAERGIAVVQCCRGDGADRVRRPQCSDLLLALLFPFWVDGKTYENPAHFSEVLISRFRPALEV